MLIIEIELFSSFLHLLFDSFVSCGYYKLFCSISSFWILFKKNSMIQKKCRAEQDNKENTGYQSFIPFLAQSPFNLTKYCIQWICFGVPKIMSFSHCLHKKSWSFMGHKQRHIRFNTNLEGKDSSMQQRPIFI